MSRRAACGFALVETAMVLVVLVALFAIGAIIWGRGTREALQAQMADRDVAAMERVLDAALRRATAERDAAKPGDTRVWTWDDLAASGYALANDATPANVNSLGQVLNAYVTYQTTEGSRIRVVVYDATNPLPDKLKQAGLTQTADQIVYKNRVVARAVDRRRFQAAVADTSRFTTALKARRSNLTGLLPAGTSVMQVRAIMFSGIGDRLAYQDNACQGATCQDNVTLPQQMTDCEIAVSSSSSTGGIGVCPAGKETVAQFPLCLGGKRSFNSEYDGDWNPWRHDAQIVDTQVGQLTFDSDVRMRAADTVCGGSCNASQNAGCAVTNIARLGCAWWPFQQDRQARGSVTFLPSGYRIGASAPAFDGIAAGIWGTWVAVPAAGENASVGVTIPSSPPGATFVDMALVNTIRLNNNSLGEFTCATNKWTSAANGTVSNSVETSIKGMYDWSSIRLSNQSAALCCRTARGSIVP